MDCVAPQVRSGLCNELPEAELGASSCWYPTTFSWLAHARSKDGSKYSLFSLNTGGITALPNPTYQTINASNLLFLNSVLILDLLDYMCFGLQISLQ